ncbi:MAG: SRPBCC domain-containing protein [Candidatus Aenigmarchaeota archaeon]|nr:SRPBCC domain-containing protein [Candidatus Aenigmarchaeota archaeon]
MDSKKHSAFTGSKAKISRRTGGSFSAYDGGLHGKNTELTKDKKIVQAWRCEMEGWPEKHFSKAVFSLKGVKNGTRLDFIQTDVPDACAKSIAEGWHNFYWKPIGKMLKT